MHIWCILWLIQWFNTMDGVKELLIWDYLWFYLRNNQNEVRNVVTVFCIVYTHIVDVLQRIIFLKDNSDTN